VAAGADPGPEGPRNEDALALLAASSVSLRYEQVNPCCLRSATSPHLAARRESSSIDIEEIKSTFAAIQSISDVIIVEGAGGWMAPIADPVHAGEAGPTMQDIALVLRLPVLLVVGIKLGCISHALLTAAAIERSGLPLAGWVANPVAPDFTDHAEYVQSLALRLPAPQLSI
jgi:dethiobiotin synthetase